MTGTPCPKPTPRPKKAKRPMQRKARLQARHWGVSRVPSKTAYARRARELGRMAFVRSLPCCCTRTYLIGRGFGPCSGRMHAHHAGTRGLGVKAPDNTCVPLCEGHHRAYHDGLGLFGAATKAETRGWMDRRIAETRAAWDALGDSERARWDETAAARRKG